MKKVLSVFLSIIMLLSITAGIDLAAYADGNSRSDIKEYNDLYYTAVKEACVSGYKGNNKFLIIPSEIEGIPVVRIANSWFDEYNNKVQYTTIARTMGPNVEYLQISDGIRVIDSSAFNNFENLKELYIGKGVEAISFSAFCSDIPVIYYAGTEEEWNNISGMSDCMRWTFSKTEIHYNYEICKHENTEVFDAYDSTCDKEGNTGKILCLDCRKIIDTAGKPIPYKPHKYTETVVAPTCDKTGYTLIGCEVCNYRYEKNHILPLGHKSTSVIIKDATCTKLGEEKHTCSVCNATWTTTIPKKEHEYEIEIIETSCTDVGLIIYKCKNCWRSYSEVTADALGHNYVIEKVAPRCESDGYTLYTCTRCGYYYKDINYGSAIGHNYVEDVINKPCTDYGLKGKHCTICGYDPLDREIIYPKEHSFGAGKVMRESTCCTEGIIEYTCKECGEIKKENLPRKEHIPEVKITAPTCTKDGSKNYYCKECGIYLHWMGEVIKATGHKIVIDKAVPPTCGKLGKTEGSHCSVCGKTIKYQEYVKATGHKEVTDKAIAPTCTTAGKTAGSHCSECNMVLDVQNTIPATGHKYKTTTTKATTKKNGSVVKKCSACGVSTKTTIYYPKTITLSTTSYTYDGKVKKPSVTVKDSKGKKIAASNYTVTYASGRKNVGIYTVTIKFKGNYSGTVKKTFTIKPKATTLSSVTAKSKGFTVKWKKQATQTTGYQIQYSTSSKFSSAKTVTISKNSTTSKAVSKLKAKKKYYVRVRTYKTVKVNGKSTKIYSSWSKSKVVTTKK